MRELLVRALTGAVYVGLTIAACWAGGFTIALLFLPVCLFAADELHKLCWPANEGPPRYWSVLLACATYVVVALVPQFVALPIELLEGLIVLMVCGSVVWLLFLDASHPAQALGGALLAIVYCALPFALLPHFRSFGDRHDGPEVLIGFFLLLWTNDTGAYLIGRSLGRHKLMPSVSPKKTIEGLIGGALLTLLLSVVLARIWPVIPERTWIIGGAVVAVTATLGDLFESAMKRSRGVKDSGSVLPGHGGVLDRFDGLLLSAPAMYLLLKLAG